MAKRRDEHPAKIVTIAQKPIVAEDNEERKRLYRTRALPSFTTPALLVVNCVKWKLIIYLTSLKRSHQTDRTLMVKINQAQTPVGSIQGGVLLSRVNTNPDDDDDENNVKW